MLFQEVLFHFHVIFRSVFYSHRQATPKKDNSTVKPAKLYFRSFFGGGAIVIFSKTTFFAYLT